jgi:putative glycerol-1-phosphate prenyltransferase
MKNRIYESLVVKKSKGEKSFAVLVDPDKVNADTIDELITLANAARLDFSWLAESCYQQSP